jgi:hypothetical protein
MLADSVEAATRSLQDKSLENVEAMVDEIVESRYEEGQLDETNLTFSDLTKIKESFLAVMSGIYHKRIEYPGQFEKIPSGEEDLSDSVIPHSESSNGADNVPEPVGELSQKEIDGLAPPVSNKKRKTRKTLRSRARDLRHGTAKHLRKK